MPINRDNHSLQLKRFSASVATSREGQRSATTIEGSVASPPTQPRDDGACSGKLLFSHIAQVARATYLQAAKIASMIGKSSLHVGTARVVANS